MIEGFVTRENMPRAGEIAKEALQQWRKAQPELRQSVSEMYDLDRLPGWNFLGDSLQEFYLADLLRSGYGATPSRKERRQALKHFRRSVEKALRQAGQGHARVAAAPAYEIGHCYYFGECGGRSVRQAIRSYRATLAHVPNDGFAWVMLMMSMVELQLNSSQLG